MEVIKLFRVSIVMPEQSFLAWQSGYFAKGDHFGSLVSSVGFSKKPMTKIGNFAMRKKGREKTRMAKVAKCCHQVTCTKKGDQK